MNTTRLRELCDAFDAGALRDEELRELVGLAREAADGLMIATKNADEAGLIIGQVIAATTLAPGESMVSKVQHAAVSAVLDLVSERNKIIVALEVAEKRVEHIPIFCTFCGKTSGAGVVLTPHAHCNFCDTIKPYTCGDPDCVCAK